MRRPALTEPAQATQYRWAVSVSGPDRGRWSAGVAWFLISNREQGQYYDPIRIDGNSIRRQLDIFVALLRLTAVRIVLVLAIGIFVFNHAMNSWLPEILRTGGMSAAEAGVWASVPSLVGTIGPTMTGILADATGGFRVPLGTLTAVYLTCTMLVIALDRHQKRQLIG